MTEQAPTPEQIAEEAYRTVDQLIDLVPIEVKTMADEDWLDGLRRCITDALDALAAERDRADRAEAQADRAPHAFECAFDRISSGECDCWKSEATA